MIPPGLFRKVVYPVLVHTSDKLRKGLGRSKVFFPYFSMNVRYANSRARSRLEPVGMR